MSGANHRLLGRWGEAQVAQDMRKKGYQIIAASWQCRFGEIDLIVSDGKYISFTEVKLRKSASFAPARVFVDRRKQEKLRMTAQLYLAQNPTTLQPRFDVVEVYAPQGMASQKVEINYIENAF